MADAIKTYGAVITATALTTSRNGKDGVAIRFTATSDLDSGEAVDKVYTATLWLSDAALTRTIQTLREIGWDGRSFAELNDPCRLVDTPVEISVGPEEWDGKTYDKVKFVHAPGHRANRFPQPMERSAAAAMARRYDPLLAAPFAADAAGAASPAYGQPQRPQRRPQPQLPAYDPAEDLPF